MRKALIFAFLASLALVAAGDSFNEDFESYAGGKPLAKQGPWAESPYGQHPASGVIQDGATKRLAAPGGGDHYNVLKLPAPFAAGLKDAKVVGVALSFQSSALLSGSPFGALRFGARLGLDAKRPLSGLATERKGWSDAVFVFERLPDGTFKVHAGSRPNAKEPFAFDPLIESAKPLRAEGVWRELTLRLDGADAVDDLQLFTCGSLEKLPFKVAAAKPPELKFQPMLGHVIAPRTAVDLDGIWEAAASPAAETTPPAADGWQLVLVPDSHSGLFSRDKGAVWFKRTLKLDSLVPNSRYLLRFERVTDSCDVFVNGAKAGSSDDGHGPFAMDVTAALKTGANELLVKVYSPAAANAAGHRPEGFNWLYGGFTGIPYPVYLERAGETLVEDVQIIATLFPEPSLEARVQVRNGGAAPRKAALRAKSGGDFEASSPEFELAPGQTSTIVLKKAWPNPKLWWPHDPQLLNLDVSVVSGGAVVDAYRQRFGFRELKAKGPDILLNGVKVMQRRNSVIPYWNFTTDSRLREEIAQSRANGHNGWRLHGGFASPRIANVCDEEGWLLAPEGALCSPKPNQVAADFWPAAKQHIESMVKSMRDNPSVLYWCLSNEFVNYMNGADDGQKAAANAAMLALGRRAEELDPTRVWTCSGDCELAGMGKHGPAPTLSFHYAWQPSKLHNMIPNTVDWLDKGLAPWQGIVWDRTKPLMLSEDIYPPYGFDIPNGHCQWAGDSVCEPERGVYKAWFDAIRMLAAGYYQSGVSVWNPWATGPMSKDNPLFQFGQPMPDFLIACRDLPLNVDAGSHVAKTFTLHNKTFKTLQGTLKASLRLNGKELQALERPCVVPAGGFTSLELAFDIPKLPAPALPQWQTTLSDATGAVAAAQSWTIPAFPKRTVAAPAGCALLWTPGCLDAVSFPGGRFDTLKAALAARPASLALVGQKLDNAAAAALRDFVNAGGKALLVESRPSGALPLRLDATAKAAFAFVRTPADPAVKGVDDAMLRLWGPERLACQSSFLKPSEGDSEILIDSGYGLSYTPLARVRCGSGYYLLCQLPVASAFAGEPAARHLLQTILNSLAVPLPSRAARAALAADSPPRLADALRKAAIAVSDDAKKAPLLILDGTARLSPAQLELIKQRADKSLGTLVDGLTGENAAALSALLGAELKLSASSARQLLRNRTSPLSGGISNLELCWFEGDEFYSMVNQGLAGRAYQPKGEPMLGGELACSVAGTEAPFTPSGLLSIPFRNGRLLVSTVKWDAFATKMPNKARAYIAALLRNSGCRLDNGASTPRVHVPLDLAAAANRGFWNRPDAKAPGWFGDPKDDLRYFPVNVTGNDPVLNMPQPPERFPEGLLNFAGVDFKVLNPELNGGRSCLVLQPKETAGFAADGGAASLWMLGALGAMRPEGAKAATVTFTYANGTSDSRELKAGAELNGYQYPTPASRGVCAWIGPSPSRSDIVLWCWNVPVPHPGKQLGRVAISVDGDAALGLVACSLER